MDTKEQILKRDYSTEFDSLRQNSIVQSHYKYGWMSDTYPELADAFGSLIKRVELYKETGNADWLIDIANFAMIEYMHPAHSKYHFRRTHSDESPRAGWHQCKGIDGRIKKWRPVMSNTIRIHTSDPIQAAAAEAMRRAVDKRNNELNQAAYWQNIAQNKMTDQMAVKRFGRNYTEQEEQQLIGTNDRRAKQ